jgi:hypothetical protein
VVLIQLREHHQDLTLAVSIIERLIDAGRRDAESSGRFAVVDSEVAGGRWGVCRFLLFAYHGLPGLVWIEACHLPRQRGRLWAEVLFVHGTAMVHD